MCSAVAHTGHAAQPLVDLGFEASLFLLVFGAMFLAHLAGAVTYLALYRLERRLER